ncbi:DUF1707 domain-containing protein [Phytomonospora sp. NPDC050363]|uniref:DUF1707 SHOCT-like domain-containing protein n=1 Tax=Phytomonospora sp. NPDC050363 TaxID=3155642 RepID=UPI0033D0D794
MGQTHEVNTVDSERMRASNADREQVVERLRTALNEGRLNLDEFDERVSQAYGAQTYADLKPLLSDLPPPAPSAKSAITPSPLLALDPGAEKKARRRERERRAVRKGWTGWLGMSVLVTGLWFIGVAADGFESDGDLWFVWPVGIVSLVMIVRTIAYVAKSDD